MIKRELTKIFAILVDNHIWISVAAMALAWQTAFVLDISLSIEMYGFICGGTLFTYHFQRLVKRRQDYGRYASRKTSIIFTAIGLIVSVYAFIEFERHTRIIAIIAALWSILYVMPVPYFTGGNGMSKAWSWKRIRDLPVIKIFIVVITWSVVTVILPSSEEFTRVNPDTWKIFGERFLFIFGLTIPFDIRDLFDDDFSMKTIPQLIGIRYSKIFAISCLILSMMMSFSIYWHGVYDQMLLFAFIISGIITAFYVSKAGFGKSERFYTGLLDGMMILQPALVYLFAF